MIFCDVPQAPSCIHSLVFMMSFKLPDHVTTRPQSSFDMTDKISQREKKTGGGVRRQVERIFLCYNRSVLGHVTNEPGPGSYG